MSGARLAGAALWTPQHARATRGRLGRGVPDQGRRLTRRGRHSTTERAKTGRTWRGG